MFAIAPWESIGVGSRRLPRATAVALGMTVPKSPHVPHYVIARRDDFCPDVAISGTQGVLGTEKERLLRPLVGPRNDRTVGRRKSEIATHPSGARNDEDGKDRVVMTGKRGN